MKIARPQTTEASALDKRNSNPEHQRTVTAKFLGTDNPRELRAIHSLLVRPMPREHLDRAVGCSNGPDLVSRLRDKGLELPCDMVPDTDRDGNHIKRGVYFFTSNDRRHIRAWQARRKGA